MDGNACELGQSPHDRKRLHSPRTTSSLYSYKAGDPDADADGHSEMTQSLPTGRFGFSAAWGAGTKWKRIQR